MTLLAPETAVAALYHLGWPTPRSRFPDAVRAFQAGWNLGEPLTVDGIVGPATSAALRTSQAMLERGLPTASQHFSFREFTCRCGGSLPGCAGVEVNRGLLAGLERLREAYYPTGLTIRSGYRCPRRNSTTGGAPDSQHLYGSAADIDYAVKSAAVERLRVFSGIGYSAITGLVRHVDVRHLDRHNSTGGTTITPTTWPYAD